MVNTGSSATAATLPLEDKDTDFPALATATTASRSLTLAEIVARGRIGNAPGSTGRGPAFGPSSATTSALSPHAGPSWSFRPPALTRSDSQDSPQEELIRAGEAEREAQRAMIDAQRETIRAGDQVIDALRQQVRTLQSRLDETSGINAALMRAQGQILREQQRLAADQAARANAWSERSQVETATMPMFRIETSIHAEDSSMADEEEDIYADMPPLEGFSEPSSSSTLEEATTRLHRLLEQSDFNPERDHASVVEPSPVTRIRAQDEALERLRADAGFRARVQQYMHPETASRILRVLDRSGGNVSSSSQAVEERSVQPEQIPGSPLSDARARFELERGYVDRNGDFTQKCSSHRYTVGR